MSRVNTLEPIPNITVKQLLDPRLAKQLEHSAQYE